MNRKGIFQTVGMINDDLIAQAGNPAGKIKRLKIWKIAAVSAAAVMLLGATVLAAGILLGGRGGHSLNIPSYYSVPDPQVLHRDIGIAPKVAAEFSNGYRFDSGYIAQNEDYNTDGSVYEAYLGLQCCYKKGNDSINLYIDAAAAGIQLSDAEKAGVYRGSQLMYHAYANKLVPPDYQMTEQDKKDEESGKYVFTYGSAQIEVQEVQGLAWEYHGLNFELIAVGTETSMDELAQMARELIDLQEETR